MIRLEKTGNNAHTLVFGAVEVYFSYATPIGFRVNGGRLVSRVNDWNNTTGKHLAYIGSVKNDRIEGKLFEEQLAKILKTHE